MEGQELSWWPFGWRRAISLPWTVACTGQVVDAEGHPMYYVLASFDGLNVRTDMGGKYGINLEPGKEYEVVFSAPEYYPANLSLSTINRISGEKIIVSTVVLQRITGAAPPEEAAEPQRGEPVITVPEIPAVSIPGLVPEEEQEQPAMPTEQAQDLRFPLVISATLAAFFAFLYLSKGEDESE